MIDDYMLALAAAGSPVATMKHRRTQLVRLARDLGGSPADVTGEHLVAWFGQPPCRPAASRPPEGRPVRRLRPKSPRSRANSAPL